MAQRQARIPVVAPFLGIAVPDGDADGTPERRIWMTTRVMNRDDCPFGLRRLACHGLVLIQPGRQKRD
jgi:hypothetical protein